MRNDGEGFVEIVGSAGIRIRVTTLDEMMLMLPGYDHATGNRATMVWRS